MSTVFMGCNQIDIYSIYGSKIIKFQSYKQLQRGVLHGELIGTGMDFSATHLKHGSSSQGNELQRLRFIHLGGQAHHVMQEKLGGLSLSGSALSADDYRLGGAVGQHGVVGTVSNGEYVRRVRTEGLALVPVCTQKGKRPLLHRMLIDMVPGFF